MTALPRNTLSTIRRTLLGCAAVLVFAAITLSVPTASIAASDVENDACPSPAQLASASNPDTKERFKFLLRTLTGPDYLMPGYFMDAPIASIPQTCLPDGADAAYDLEAGVVAVSNNVVDEVINVTDKLGFGYRTRYTMPDEAELLGVLLANSDMSRRDLVSELALLMHESYHHAQAFNGSVDSAIVKIHDSHSLDIGTHLFARLIEVPAYEKQENLHLLLGEYPESGNWYTLDDAGNLLTPTPAVLNLMPEWYGAYSDVASAIMNLDLDAEELQLPGRRFPGRRFPGAIIN